MKANKEIEILYYNILRLEEHLDDLPFNDPEALIIETEIKQMKEQIKLLQTNHYLPQEIDKTLD